MPRKKRKQNNIKCFIKNIKGGKIMKIKRNKEQGQKIEYNKKCSRC